MAFPCPANPLPATLPRMTRTEFERLVVQALDRIPEDLRLRLDNVDIVVDDAPSREQLVGSGIEESNILLGLYEGLPLTDRYNYDMVLPDKITLFQQPIESICLTDEDIIREVHDTVIHEVAHHFGIGDERLHELGL